MRLSIVIPTYSINVDLFQMANRCIDSYKLKEHDVEIIVTEDGGMFEYLHSDTYIYSPNKGFTVNVNRGWRQAQGDYVAIVSSDTYLVSGNIMDLCVTGRVTSPRIENQDIDGLAGCFFVAPWEITRRIGMLNEDMHTYFSDEDYKERTKGIFQKINSVIIHHDQARTVTAAGVNNAEQSEKDKQAYAKI